jgi:hypothetical protein
LVFELTGPVVLDVLAVPVPEPEGADPPPEPAPPAPPLACEKAGMGLAARQATVNNAKVLIFIASLLFAERKMQMLGSRSSACRWCVAASLAGSNVTVGWTFRNDGWSLEFWLSGQRPPPTSEHQAIRFRNGMDRTANEARIATQLGAQPHARRHGVFERSGTG